MACPKCGQKVSGDESFFGTTVECPICSADIQFPGELKRKSSSYTPIPVPPEERVKPSDSSLTGLPKVSEFEEPPKSKIPTEDMRPVANAETAIPLDASPNEEEEAEIPSPVFGAVSLVSAILALVTCVGGVLFAPISIIAGHTALAKARHSPIQPAPGQTLGAIGLIIGYVSLFFTILALVILVFFGDPVLGPLREAIQNNEN